MKKFFEEPNIELIKLEIEEETTSGFEIPSVEQGYDDEW